MQNRSWITPAIVLSLRSFGEGHREATLLTPDHGLVQAAVFGGAKSKLKALVSPWHEGTAWLYSDPVKKSVKITDFDVLFYRQGIRENLVRTWTASLCSEIVSRSHGITEWVLIKAFLDGIALSDESECKRALLRFIWRILVHAGINPNIYECSECGKSRENEILYYSPYEQHCLCTFCKKEREHLFVLSIQASGYLYLVENESARLVRSTDLPESTWIELRKFLFFLLAKMVDGPLKCLETSEGILGA